MRKPLVLPLIVTLVAGACLSGGDVAKTNYIFAPRLEAELGFSRAVRVRDTLYISGSVGAGEMPVAIQQAYERIGKTLEAHGLTFQNVVKDTVFTTDLDTFIANRELRKAYYGTEYPASTWVQVSRLNTPELVIEVEAIAAFPDAAQGAREAPGGDETGTDPSSELRNLREQLKRAIAAGDREGLNRLLADDFVFVHSTGAVETKAQYIERAATNAGRGNQNELRFLDENVRVYDGQVAVVVTESVRHDPKRGESLRFKGTDVLLRRDNEWQWVSVHSTRLSDNP